MIRRLFDEVCDVVTCDIIKTKVFFCAVSRCCRRSFSLLYIIFINSRNNVTTSLANVYRGFMGDVMVTFPCLVPVLSVFVGFVLFPSLCAGGVS